MAIPKPRTDLGNLYYDTQLQYADIYYEITKEPFGISLVGNIEDVKSYAAGVASRFEEKRHDGKFGDKIRTLIGNNIGTIQKVVNHFAGAATAGFPPCAPVFTAFNCVVGAIVAVKADFDLLETFFTDVGKQLNVIGVLEGAIHRINIQELVSAIKEVFTMVLRVCAFAVKYIKKKRVMHGAKSLVLGKDDDLVEAYGMLGDACKRLRDVVGVATLAMTARIDTRIEHLEEGVKEFTNTLIERTSGNQSTLSKLKKLLLKDSPDLSAAHQIRSPLVGTTTWLFEEDLYKKWESRETPILWMHGLPGTGKTFLAFSVLERLKLRSKRLRRSPCGWFFFSNTREDTKSMVNALVGAVLQIAEEDDVYAKQVLLSLEKQDQRSSWFNASLSEVWDEFFKDRFKSNLDPPEVEVSLVFDGFENVVDDERREFLKICAQMRKQGLVVRVLLVGVSDLDQDVMNLGEEEIKSMTVDNSKNRQDIDLFVDNKMKGLTRRFEEETLMTIASRLKEKGSFNYIELVLPIVAAESQDEEALDSLDTFPEAIEKGYEQLLQRIGSNIRPKEIEAFKVLIRWVAFSKRDLSLKEARSLVQLKTQYSTYNPRAPVNGKLASILALSDASEPGLVDHTDDRPTLHHSHTSRHDFLEDDEQEETSSDIYGEPDKDAQSSTDVTREKDVIEPPVDNGEATISMKADIKAWFRKATRTSKLGTRPTDAKVDLTLTCLDILSSTDQGPTFDKKKPLQDYAKDFWLEHLRDVDVEDISSEQLSSIMEKLVDVFTVPATACRHLKTIAGKTYLEFHQYPNEIPPGRELIVRWCKKATASTVKLRPRTREWIEAIIERPQKILEPLAKEHVIMFYSSETGDTLPTDFVAAFYSVITTIPALPENFTLDGGNFTVSDIQLVLDAFPEISMDATAHAAVGYILMINERHSEAREHFNQALALSESVDLSIRVLGRQARLSAASKDFTSACVSYEKALALGTRNSITDDEVEQMERAQLVATLEEGYADSLSSSNKHSDALKAWEHVLAANFTTLHFSRLMQTYAATEDYQGFMDRLKRLDRDQRAEWMNAIDSDDERLLNHAAKVTGGKDFLVQAYKETIEAAERKPSWADLFEVQARSRLAHAYWRVFDDEDAAYRELNDAHNILYPDDPPETDTEEGGRYRSTQWLQMKVNKLFSELVFSRIHASPVKWVKSLLLEELKKVAKPPMAAKGSATELWGFYYATLVAKAFLDHGRKEKTLEILNPIFADSVAALRDDTGDNDSTSFRLLARILSYMSLDRHARIAYSAQFSQVNTDFEYTRVGSNEEATDATTELKMSKAGSGEAQTSNQAEEGLAANLTEPTPKRSSEPSYEEDLSSAGASCDGCHIHIGRWTQSLYMCMVCADVDICEACHAKQVARNEGQPFTFWYDYCGQNHTYLQGPLEGWGGVKDGIMTVGEEKIKFEHWLKVVERDWQELGMAHMSRRGTTALRQKITA